MSRIGRKPIEVPKDVNIALVDNNVNVKGKLGELSFKLRSTIKVELNDNMIQVSRQSDEKKNREPIFNNSSDTPDFSTTDFRCFVLE